MQTYKWEKFSHSFRNDDKHVKDYASKKLILTIRYESETGIDSNTLGMNDTELTGGSSRVYIMREITCNGKGNFISNLNC